MSFNRRASTRSGVHDRPAIHHRRGTAAALCLVLVILTGPGTLSDSEAQDLQWESIGDGLAISVWQPGPRCPDVDSLLVVDADPERYRFSVHYYAQEGLAYPPTIQDWQKRTHHEVLFNAGLFRENFSYLGLLFKEGRSLGSRRHSTWQGLFVAEPADPATRPNARVLDLASDPFLEGAPSYREAAQSLMLLDRSGAIRVRQTGKFAYQTLVAESRNGHILVFKSLGLVTLHGIGQCLRDGFPSVRLAMAMDGGSSSDLVLAESAWKSGDLTQRQSAWKDLFAGRTTAHIALPAVIGISPRGIPASSPREPKKR